jgi:hypothetical protein
MQKLYLVQVEYDYLANLKSASLCDGGEFTDPTAAADELFRRRETERASLSPMSKPPHHLYELRWSLDGINRPQNFDHAGASDVIPAALMQ